MGAPVRKIILVPADQDQAPGMRVYWDNFVWHVEQVLAEHGIECELHVTLLERIDRHHREPPFPPNKEIREGDLPRRKRP